MLKQNGVITNSVQSRTIDRRAGNNGGPKHGLNTGTAQLALLTGHCLAVVLLCRAVQLLCCVCLHASLARLPSPGPIFRCAAEIVFAKPQEWMVQNDLLLLSSSFAPESY